MIAAGSLIGARYKVVRKIDDGGMQSVYLAQDMLVDRPVALKTPLLGQGLKRFSDSAVIAARINHHAVARTLDYFEEGGVPFLVEEYVDGPNLEAAFANGGVIDPHRGASLLLELSVGLAASHKAGVVHRDLKPSNLLTDCAAPLGRVKITDFGIATLADEVFQDAASSGDLTRSTSGTVKGALPYMAPEMMFRKPGDHPDRPADVWALGALMFKVLTGTYPFGTGFDVPVNIRTGQRAAWPLFMTSNPQFAQLSIELQSIIERCLVIDPTARPTAREMADLCNLLCFSNSKRHKGRVTSVSAYLFFANAPNLGDVFFHRDSVYGPRRPAIGSDVIFSVFPGVPKPRAHPVVVM